MNRQAKCPKCHGTGVNPNSYDEHVMTGAFHVIARPCLDCKGKGRVHRDMENTKAKIKKESF